MPRNLAPDIEQMRADTIYQIEIGADCIRLAFQSPGELTFAEYERAARAVEQWDAAGRPPDDVPAPIVSGAAYSDITHEAAANEIRDTATGFDVVLDAIRDVRLSHKRQAQHAASTTELSQIRRSAVAAYAQIRADYAGLAG